jgi:hypothetical protein
VSKRWSILGVGTCLVAAACNDSAEYHPPAPRPLIVGMTGPANSVVDCNPDRVGGSCPLAIAVRFRLPAEQFVWKAYVRFQGDGGEDGVDRGYLLTPTGGAGPDQDSNVTVNAAIPPTILRSGALFSYGVRLVTGAGEESAPSTLTVSVP